MTYYFIKDGDTELGPFTIQQLKSRLIKKETLIWFAGIQEWINAGQVYELKGIFAAKMPSRPFPKSILYKIWDSNPLKQQVKRVS